MTTPVPWWRDAVIYQIYPRSFADSDGDGVGDLRGVIDRLDHLGPAGLGIDAIWLSPIYPSADRDFGYDVTNFTDVHPRYGTLADFDELIAEAGAHGVRVILDFVPNHTSTDHPWFVESRSDPDSRKRSWYLWRDGAAGGEPPNNWGSHFGGAAWRYDEASGQWYLASFLAEQADVDWRTPALAEAMLEAMRFWFDRGVAGFRLDVVDQIAKDPELRSNPLAPGKEALVDVMPFRSQQHRYDRNFPDLPVFLARMRALADEAGERVLIGEVFPDTPEHVRAYYGTADAAGLQLAFNFNISIADAPWNAGAFRRALTDADEQLPEDAWPCWVLSNHDKSRHASRHDPEAEHPDRPKAAAALLLCLRGTPVMYYGEEIGMRDVTIPKERVLDPVGLTFPGFGRDPERTPMRWSNEPGLGFTTGEPWLPDGGDIPSADVAAQLEDPESTLSAYRALLRLRRDRPSLRRGDQTLLETPDTMLAWTREHDGERTAIAINFDSAPAAMPPELASGSLRYDSHAISAPGQVPTDLAPDQAIVLDLDA